MLIMELTQGYTGKSREKSDSINKAQANSPKQPVPQKPAPKPAEQPKKKEPVKTEKPQMSSTHDDEKFYEQVASELQGGNTKQGLWLKAETKARGDKDEARLLYIEWRVEQLTEEEREAQKKEEERSAKEAEELAQEELQSTFPKEGQIARMKLDLKNFDTEEGEALNKIMLSGFLWEVAYTFAADFKGWEVSNSDGRVVFLNTKAELLEWVGAHISLPKPEVQSPSKSDKHEDDVGRGIKLRMSRDIEKLDSKTAGILKQIEQKGYLWQRDVGLWGWSDDSWSITNTFPRNWLHFDNIAELKDWVEKNLPQ
jgi:hypothetical protein